MSNWASFQFHVLFALHSHFRLCPSHLSRSSLVCPSRFDCVCLLNALFYYKAPHTSKTRTHFSWFKHFLWNSEMIYWQMKRWVGMNYNELSSFFFVLTWMLHLAPSDRNIGRRRKEKKNKSSVSHWTNTPSAVCVCLFVCSCAPVFVCLCVCECVCGEKSAFS